MSASYPATTELRSPRAAESLMIRLRPAIVDPQLPANAGS